MPMRWEKLKSKYLLERWWMNLREDHVRLPNGHELEEYHVLEYPDWVCIVSLTEDDQIVLIEQYRYGIDRVTLELPGGVVDLGEDPSDAARRELLEETGYAAQELIFIGKVAPDPSRHTNWAWIYFAPDATRIADQQLDPGENLTVRLVTVAEALDSAERGWIVHGIHLTALFWASKNGHLTPDPASPLAPPGQST